MGFTRVFLLILFFARCVAAEEVTVTVVGTGLTGLWTAYSICKDVEEAGKGDQIHLVVLGKWDWLSELDKASNQELTFFTHETSGFGPIGIQPHSGLLWNTDNEVVDLVKKGIGNREASFYTSEALEEEGKEFLELYVGWHGRHPDQENDPASSFHRQQALVEINRYARALWGQFAKRNVPIDLHLEGAWRLYDDPLLFANALNSLKILQKLDYTAEAVHNPEELAMKLPFYREAILKDQKLGIFFSDDGLIDSNQLRRFLWAYLKEESEGKPRITFRLDGEISSLHLDPEGNCKGVFLANRECVESDITILAMGLGNSPLLSQYDIELPLWSVWGAAIKAPLIDTEIPPKGGVSFHRERCITAATDGKIMTVAGMSLVMPAKTIPEEGMVKSKLRQNLTNIFGERVDRELVKFRVAPRTGIPDDLPIIALNVPHINNLIVLNPTSHLGNTQSIALGKIASTAILEKIGVSRPYPEGLDLFNYRIDRFAEDIQKVRSERALGRSILF